MTGHQATGPKPEPGEWASRGNCVGLPSSWFFPEREDDSGRGNPEVRRVCASCCVQQECLEYALMAPPTRYGWWGGRSPRERAAITRQRRKAASA